MNIWDRVAAKRLIDDRIKIGSIGKIIDILKSDKNRICVEWNDTFYGGHDGDGLGENGHCWWVYKNDLILIDEKDEDKSVKVRWYKNGKLQ